MSAANSKIKFIILLILVILRVHFPCLADEKPSEHEIKSLIQNLTFKSPLFDKSRRDLIRIGPPAVEYLIRALKNENWQIRISAASILGKIGDKRALKPLIQSLTDKSRDVRCSAACALGDIKDKNALDPLVETLKDEYWQVRYWAVWALEEIKDKKILEPLIETLKDEHWEVRRSAVWALYELKDKKASHPLVETLTDKRWEVRKDAAFVLRELGDQKAVKPLIQALQDKKWQIREQAAFTLGMIGDKRAVIPLIKALSDKTIEVRKSAVQGLDELRDKRALEPIIQVLKDVNSSVRLYAVRALEQIGGKKAIEPLSHTLLNDGNEEVRQNAARVLGSIGDKRAADPLFHALNDSNKQVRIWAALSLGKVHDKRAIEPLIEIIREGEWDVRLYALLALGEIGDESVVEPLMELYSSSESKYYLNLIKAALGKICQTNVKPLIQALKHEKWQIREASAVILGEFRDPETTGSLVQALEDKNKYVRHAATKAFFEIGACKGFQDIDYPGEIIIKKGEFLNLNEKITIRYKYYGKDITSNDGEYGRFSYMQTYSINGHILYYDKVGKKLPEAYHYFKESGFDGFQRNGGTEGSNNLKVFLKNNELYSFDIYILSPSIFGSTDVDEFITKKDLSEILISIDDFQIFWELIDQFHRGKERTRKGDYFMKVNQTISIKVKYED